MSQLHESITNVLRFFEYEHLPEKLQVVSQDFYALANKIADRTRDEANGPETTVALRKLLEAKDAAVRAVL